MPGLTTMRLISMIIGLLAAIGPLCGSTLEQLSLDEMIDKSTEIVRGRILSSRTAMRGPVIYTYAEVQVIERWKGPSADRVEVALPGGAYRRLQQSFSGTPSLRQDTEYVLFLWTGKNGVTQVIGLSQGVFNVRTNQQGELVVERGASQEVMLDSANGKPVQDQAVSMRLADLQGRVQRVLVSGSR